MKRLLCLALVALLAVPLTALAQSGNQISNIFAPVLSQRVTFGGPGATCSAACTQQASSAFARDTRAVRVILTDATAYIGFAVSGQTPSVTAATGIYMPVNVAELFRVPANGKLYVLGHSATGYVGITEFE